MGLFLSVSAFRDLRDAKARGVFFSLSGTLGERISATVSRSRQNDVRTTTTTLSRSVSYGGGFGWACNRSTTMARPVPGAGPVPRQLRPGRRTQQTNGQRTSAVDVAGALVLMDGGVHAARQVGAGFALVSTDGVGGVPVLQENQVIGKTSGSGYMLVPNLNPTSSIRWHRHQQPAARCAHRQHRAGRGAGAPVRRAGALPGRDLRGGQRHPARRRRPAAGRRHHGAARGKRQSTVVGYDGVAFIDHLQR
jgi:outer membrane usher protein